MLVNPKLSPGESTYWYVSFWNFVSEYLKHTYDNKYCLSAKQSLDLHTLTTSIPKQIIVIVKKGGGNILKLPFDCSLLTYQDSRNIPNKTVKINGLNVMDLSYALFKVSPLFFSNNAREAEIALNMVRSPESLLEVIHKHKLTTAGNRLIGAYQFLKNVIYFLAKQIQIPKNIYKIYDLTCI